MKQPKPYARPRQRLPGEIVSDLMAAIRGPFYGDATPKQWAQDYHFIRDRVVLWPAPCLDKRGVILKPERYNAIILEVLQEIKHHGNTGQITYWPAYLAKCVPWTLRIEHLSTAISGSDLKIGAGVIP